MKHTLVLPQDMIDKLNVASSDKRMLNKWEKIDVDNTDKMIDFMIDKLNKENAKLNINGIRIEDSQTIKNRVENAGSVSKFGGYFENEKGNVDALFFYIEPNVGSANDFLSRYVMPVVLGIYKTYENRTAKGIDLHINYMPIYIVSFCSTSRIGNNSVKKNIVLAETMGFTYIDVFNNPYHDVINKTDSNGDPVTIISSLEDLDDFLKDGGSNEYFDVNYTHKTLTIKPNILDKSINTSAELYRYALRVIPAVYLAGNRKFTVSTEKSPDNSTDSVKLLYRFLNKF